MAYAHVINYKIKKLYLKKGINFINFLFRFDETLWKYYDLSNKIVHGEKLVKLLNIGVKLFSLQQAELRKSKKKFFNPSETTSLATQIDTHLLRYI